MKLHTPKLSYYIPDAIDKEQALQRCTHLCVGTHPDDVELLGMHGIMECYENKSQFFAGVVVTDGAGSPRSGKYANISDEEMIKIRAEEQNQAAKLGRYGIQLQLAYPSTTVKKDSRELVSDLLTILKTTQAEVIYLHNPLDRHATHISVLNACVQALRELPINLRPKKIYGVEVWRSLDWLENSLRVNLPVDKIPYLAEKIIAVFDSQIAGGKRYDLAYSGRILANATFSDSHDTDQHQAVILAVDLVDFIHSEKTIREFCLELVEMFKQSI